MIHKNQLNQLPDTTIPYGQMNLIINFRNLWLDLATWTRNYFVSVISGYGNADMVGARLYKIPVDFYNRLQMIFGIQQSEQFVQLLSTHIALIRNLSSATKNGDILLTNNTITQLYQNSSAIASYLEQINPFWNNVQWKNLLDQYVKMTIDELVALQSGDFANDIEIYDRITYYTLLLGDYMANGIIQYLIVRGGQQQQQLPMR